MLISPWRTWERSLNKWWRRGLYSREREWERESDNELEDLISDVDGTSGVEWGGVTTGR